MLVAPLARLGLALGLLAPLALAVPGSTFTGVTCGDDLGETCPRKPFPESSFTVVACTDNGKLEDYPEYSFYGVRNSVAECAQLAVSKAIMFAVYNAAEGAPPSYTCWGADNHIGTSRVQCEPNVRFRIRVFFHPPAAQASGLSRRRLAKPDAVPTLCPSGLTACKILNSADGYECIDTLSELESCGGCRYGVQAAPVSLRANRRLRSFANIDGTSSHQPVAPIVEEASVGVDCSERRHFGPGLTCTKGACVPYV